MQHFRTAGGTKNRLHGPQPGQLHLEPSASQQDAFVFEIGPDFSPGKWFQMDLGL